LNQTHLLFSFSPITLMFACQRERILCVWLEKLLFTKDCNLMGIRALHEMFVKTLIAWSKIDIFLPFWTDVTFYVEKYTWKNHTKIQLVVFTLTSYLIVLRVSTYMIWNGLHPKTFGRHQVSCLWNLSAQKSWSWKWSIYFPDIVLDSWKYNLFLPHVIIHIKGNCLKSALIYILLNV